MAALATDVSTVLVAPLPGPRTFSTGPIRRDVSPLRPLSGLGEYVYLSAPARVRHPPAPIPTTTTPTPTATAHTRIAIALHRPRPPRHHSCGAAPSPYVESRSPLPLRPLSPYTFTVTLGTQT